MAPDPGTISAVVSSSTTTHLLDEDALVTETAVSASPNFVEMEEIIPEEEEEDEGVVMVDGAESVSNSRSTFSCTIPTATTTTASSANVHRSPSQRNANSSGASNDHHHLEASPSRHHRHSVRRQRLASHYLNQLQLPDHYLRHYYHHHQQPHFGSSHHSAYNYPSLRRQTAANAASVESVGPSQSREPNERSPFLMIKILLFSMMTIDFVMNSIGLAVIIVLAKNHFNNIQVEQSLQQQHHRQQASSLSMPLGPSPSLGRAGDQPFGDLPFGSDQISSEWSFLLPLLPSFIFVEILTLVGMFGVFCDLFSFTMTYAILKLITSLCYPSMASAAAVAAMATAASSSTVTTTIATANVTNSLPFQAVNDTYSTMFPMFDNFTYERSQNYLMPKFVITPTTTTPTPPNNQLRHVLPVTEKSTPSDLWTITDSPTTELPTTPPDPYLTVTDPPSTISSPTEPTSQPATNNSSLPQQPSPDLSASINPTNSTSITNAPNSNKTTTSDSASNSYAAINKNTNYKHTRLKYLDKEALKQKKNEKLAKLKAKDKQLRSRLLRMESQFTYDNVPKKQGQSIASSKLSAVPYGATITTSSGYNRTAWPQFDKNQARLSMILPIDQHHNIKYHHRVWDALLVTFEVIFAVAFAFNTLTSQRIRDANGSCDHENGVGTGRARRATRSRGSRSFSNRSALSGPYSPLPNSVDAYYFAQFHLPPPPPSYFSATSSGTNNHRSQSSPSSQRQFSHSRLFSSSLFQAQFNSPSTSPQPPQMASGTVTSRPPPHTAATRSGHRWRRLTPSWLRRNGRTPAPLQQHQLPTPSAEIVPPENPPSYDEIQHDRPILLINSQRHHQGTNLDRNSGSSRQTTSLSTTNHRQLSTERIVLQVMDNGQQQTRTTQQRRQSHTTLPHFPTQLRHALSLPMLNESTILEDDSEESLSSTVLEQVEQPASLQQQLEPKSDEDKDKPRSKIAKDLDSVTSNYRPEEIKTNNKATNVTICIRNGSNESNNSTIVCPEPEPKPDYVTSNHNQTLVISINDTPV